MIINNLSNEYGLIGNAFDYMLRFDLNDKYKILDNKIFFSQLLSTKIGQSNFSNFKIYNFYKNSCQML